MRAECGRGSHLHQIRPGAGRRQSDLSKPSATVMRAVLAKTVAASVSRGARRGCAVPLTPSATFSAWPPRHTRLCTWRSLHCRPPGRSAGCSRARSLRALCKFHTRGMIAIWCLTAIVSQVSHPQHTQMASSKPCTTCGTAATRPNLGQPRMHGMQIPG